MSGIKTFSNETSERYALALLELANENSEVGNIEKNVLIFLKACEENSEFFNFLKKPTYQLEIQSKVFNKISDVLKLSRTFNNFLQFIIKKRRIYFLYNILKSFIKLNTKEKGIVNAVLTSSKDLSEEEKNKINTEISKAISSTVNFSYKIDKKLISGVKVQVGSLLIDTSVSNKLKKFKQTMIEN